VTYPPDPQASAYPGNYPAGPGNYPASGYGPPPPAQYGVPQAPPRLRGRRPIQVGIALLVAGLALAIVGGVFSSANADSKVPGFQRVALADRTGTVTFKSVGGYLAYYESSTVTAHTNSVPVIGVTLTNQATGQQMNLDTLYGQRADGRFKALRYDYKGHKGLATWQFHIDQAGPWKVELAPTPGAAADAQVAFGKSIAKGVVVGAVLILVGVLAMLGGLITLIVGLVKRRRHKRELRTSNPYAALAGGPSWPGSPGGSGGWPQSPPWTPPPGQAQPPTESGWPPPGGGTPT
jgi:hypothetical protein